MQPGHGPQSSEFRIHSPKLYAPYVELTYFTHLHHTKLSTREGKISKIEKRLQRLEQVVFGPTRSMPKPAVPEQGSIHIADLKIPTIVLSALQSRIRKVSYFNLILILLYFSSQPLKYSNMMSLSGELKKTLSYDWLNTEFHRKIHSGLVRSDPTRGSPERIYSLNEPGRKRAESVLAALTATK